MTVSKAPDPKMQTNIRCNYTPWNAIGKKFTMCYPRKGQEGCLWGGNLYTEIWNRNTTEGLEGGRIFQEETHWIEIEMERAWLQGSSRGAEGLKTDKQQRGSKRWRGSEQAGQQKNPALYFIQCLMFSQDLSSPGIQHRAWLERSGQWKWHVLVLPEMSTHHSTPAWLCWVSPHSGFPRKQRV